MDTSRYKPELLKVFALKRMRLLYNSINKTKFAKFLLESFIPKEERTIIFCGSIEQAEKICTNTFHSKVNDIAYNLFKQEKINSLSCVDAINEGDNISNLDNAIITKIKSKDLTLLQQIGRIIRFRPKHIAKNLHTYL